MSDYAPPVIARVEGRAGCITLNRPQALNALNLEMCGLIVEALLAWREDPAVEAVMFDHAGPRGFCAGGDVRALATGTEEEVRAFFLQEYRLVEFLHRYPKPTVAVMDGVTMGGGLGLAWPCRYRVATEKSLLAMPEGTIGLFPDVGMGWKLPRLPGAFGLWFALTGARLGPADSLLVGLATDYVPADRLAALKAGFVEDPGQVEARLTELEGDAGEPPLALIRDDIDRLFAGKSIEAILGGLRGDGSDFARAQLDALSQYSPTTLKVAVRQLAEGAAHPRLAGEMAVEYGLAVRIATGHDFKAGVRALLIDKTRDPRWSPTRVEEVDEAALDALFAPLEGERGWTPLP